MAIKAESIELSTGGWNYTHGYCDMKVIGFFQMEFLEKARSIMQEGILIFADFRVGSTTYRLNGGKLYAIGWDCLATRKAYLCFRVNRDGLSVVQGGE